MSLICGMPCSRVQLELLRLSPIFAAVALVKFPFSQQFALSFYLIYIGKTHFVAHSTADHDNLDKKVALISLHNLPYF